MANRTGRGIGVQRYKKSSGISSAIPSVNISEFSGASPAGAQAAYTSAEAFQNISKRMEDRLDFRAAKQATEEGRAAGRSGIPQLRDEETIKGAAFNKAAMDSMRTDFDLKSRMRLSELEEQYANDPNEFEVQSQAFIQGHLSALREGGYPDIAQEVQDSFMINSRNALVRIKNNAMAIESDRQYESALLEQIELQKQIRSNAASLFSSEPQDIPALLSSMEQSVLQLADTADHIGPDGRPLFSARERVAASQMASNVMGEAIGMAYMQSQPDLLAGYQSFMKGDAQIKVDWGDGVAQGIALDDVLTPDVKAQVGKTYMENLRSELALRNQIDTARDKAFKDRSDALFSDMSIKIQDGSLTMQDVEAGRSFLEPDRYIALRELVKSGGASVSDGEAITRLAVMDAAGIDIRKDVVTAYKSGQLTRDDFIKYYGSNTTRLSVGARDPIETGRDYLTKGLGALSSEIGLAQSVSIGAAQAEYEIQIEQFIQEKARQPSTTEARDIAENIKGRYSVLNIQDSLLTLPLPSSMTNAEKLSRDLNSGTIAEKVKKVQAQFLKKYNGNVELRNDDPAYLKEMELLKQYYDLLQVKETGGVNNGK